MKLLDAFVCAKVSIVESVLMSIYVLKSNIPVIFPSKFVSRSFIHSIWKKTQTNLHRPKWMREIVFSLDLFYFNQNNSNGYGDCNVNTIRKVSKWLSWKYFKSLQNGTNRRRKKIAKILTCEWRAKWQTKLEKSQRQRQRKTGSNAALRMTDFTLQTRQHDKRYAMDFYMFIFSIIRRTAASTLGPYQSMHIIDKKTRNKSREKDKYYYS